MNKFCHNCGKSLPIVVGMKFCPFCNTSLLSISSTPTPAAPSFTPFAPRSDDDDESVDHIDHLRLSINRLEVDITPYRQPTETVGALIAQGDVTQPPSPIVTQRGGGLPLEAVMQEFQKEAGSLRRD